MRLMLFWFIKILTSYPVSLNPQIKVKTQVIATLDKALGNK